MMAAYGNYVSNGNCLTCVGSKGVPKRLGMEGTRYVGSQFLVGVVTAAATSALFDGSGLADIISVNLLALDPDSLNGRLAAIANLYRLYQWKHIRIDYESASSTATAGAFALGILPHARIQPTELGLNPRHLVQFKTAIQTSLGHIMVTFLLILRLMRRSHLCPLIQPLVLPPRV